MRDPKLCFQAYVIKNFHFVPSAAAVRTGFSPLCRRFAAQLSLLYIIAPSSHSHINCHRRSLLDPYLPTNEPHPSLALPLPTHSSPPTAPLSCSALPIANHGGALSIRKLVRDRRLCTPHQRILSRRHRWQCQLLLHLRGRTRRCDPCRTLLHRRHTSGGSSHRRQPPRIARAFDYDGSGAATLEKLAARVGGHPAR